MTDKEFLTEWLIKYGMEWVDWREAYDEFDQFGERLWTALSKWLIERKVNTHDPRDVTYRLTQKAIELIKEDDNDNT